MAIKKRRISGELPDGGGVFAITVIPVSCLPGEEAEAPASGEMKWRNSCHQPHRHKCPGCGFVWAHDPDQIDDNDDAHKCPVWGCGRYCYEVYRGDEQPEFTDRHGVSGELDSLWEQARTPKTAKGELSNSEEPDLGGDNGNPF